VFIGFKGKIIYLGSYFSKKEAIEARKRGEEKYFQPMVEKYNKKRGVP
jgi:hypothetical protein